MPNDLTKQTNLAGMVFTPLHVDQPSVTLFGSDVTLNNSFAPNYAMEEVYGRKDPIAIYKNTKRTIAGTINVLNEPEVVIRNMSALNKLAQFLYPVYAESTQANSAILKAPPFLSLKYLNVVGTLDGGETGFLTSLTYNAGNLSKDITRLENSSVPESLYPTEIAISFSFQIIHKNMVGWVGNEFSPGGYGNSFPFNLPLGSEANTDPASTAGTSTGDAQSINTGAQEKAALNS